MVPVENRELAAIGVKTLLKMLIDDNFLHADLHPGNILVRLPGGIQGGFSTMSDVISGKVKLDGSSANGDANGGSSGGGTGAKGGAEKGASHQPHHPPSKPEIVILDTGLATELTPAHQASLAEFFQAIINWDGANVAKNIIAFSSNLQPSFDSAVFTKDVTTAGATLPGQHAASGRLHGCHLRDGPTTPRHDRSQRDGRGGDGHGAGRVAVSVRSVD
jgi:aarF domain-containing kinase